MAKTACIAGAPGDRGLIPGREDPLEEEMAPPPVFLPGEFSGTEEPGGLESIGSQRVRHN